MVRYFITFNPCECICSESEHIFIQTNQGTMTVLMPLTSLVRNHVVILKQIWSERSNYKFSYCYVHLVYNQLLRDINYFSLINCSMAKKTWFSTS